MCVCVCVCVRLCVRACVCVCVCVFSKQAHAKPITFKKIVNDAQHKKINTKYKGHKQGFCLGSGARQRRWGVLDRLREQRGLNTIAFKPHGGSASERVMGKSMGRGMV